MQPLSNLPGSCASIPFDLWVHVPCKCGRISQPGSSNVTSNSFRRSSKLKTCKVHTHKSVANPSALFFKDVWTCVDYFQESTVTKAHSQRSVGILDFRYLHSLWARRQELLPTRGNVKLTGWNDMVNPYAIIRNQYQMQMAGLSEMPTRTLRTAKIHLIAHASYDVKNISKHIQTSWKMCTVSCWALVIRDVCRTEKSVGPLCWTCRSAASSWVEVVFSAGPLQVISDSWRDEPGLPRHRPVIWWTKFEMSTLVTSASSPAKKETLLMKAL